MAVRQSFADCAPALWLGAFTLFWVAGFDVIYATQDAAFDRRAGLHSLPSRLGTKRALAVAALFHALAFGALATKGTPSSDHCAVLFTIEHSARSRVKKWELGPTPGMPLNR